MSRRITYNDLCNGEDEKELRRLLGDSEDNSGRAGTLKKVMLNVIKNELTARQKEIIMLYYFKGADVACISERLGVSQQAVYAAMSRAKKTMYGILKYYI